MIKFLKNSTKGTKIRLIIFTVLTIFFAYHSLACTEIIHILSKIDKYSDMVVQGSFIIDVAFIYEFIHKAGDIISHIEGFLKVILYINGMVILPVISLISGLLLKTFGLKNCTNIEKAEYTLSFRTMVIVVTISLVIGITQIGISKMITLILFSFLWSAMLYLSYLKKLKQ